MFAQLIASGTGPLSLPAVTCVFGQSPRPTGVCFESGGTPASGSCIDTGYVPSEEGSGCFFGQTPY